MTMLLHTDLTIPFISNWILFFVSSLSCSYMLLFLFSTFVLFCCLHFSKSTFKIILFSDIAFWDINLFNAHIYTPNTSDSAVSLSKIVQFLF